MHKKPKKTFKFKSKVIIWGVGMQKGDDKGAWRFAYLPEKVAEKIKEMQKGKLRRGWGAVYVNAKVKKTQWQTSIFPDKRSNTYVLPLKKEVRFEANLYDGEEFNFSIEISP